MNALIMLIDLLALVFLWAVVWVAVALRYPSLDRLVTLETVALIAVSAALSLVLLMSAFRYVRMEG